MSAQDLTKALDLGRWHGSSGVARCPAHKDRTPSLSISQSGQRILIHCHAGCDQQAVIGALKQRGLWPDEVRTSRSPRSAGSRQDDAKAKSEARRSDGARHIWCGSTPITGTPAEAYLRGRGLRPGLDGWPATLRYHDGLKHGPTGLVLSALVAAIAVWPASKVVSVQRTYLRVGSGNTIRVEKPKLSLGPIRGGAVRLAAAGEMLCIAEGVETALSVQQATGLPCWAVLGATNLKNVVLPPFVRELVVACDGDKAGRAAAQAAGERWVRVGYRVRVADPGDGADWNDMLQRGAP